MVQRHMLYHHPIGPRVTAALDLGLNPIDVKDALQFENFMVMRLVVLGHVLIEAKVSSFGKVLSCIDWLDKIPVSRFALDCSSSEEDDGIMRHINNFDHPLSKTIQAFDAGEDNGNKKPSATAGVGSAASSQVKPVSWRMDQPASRAHGTLKPTAENGRDGSEEAPQQSAASDTTVRPTTVPTKPLSFSHEFMALRLDLDRSAEVTPRRARPTRRPRSPPLRAQQGRSSPRASGRAPRPGGWAAHPAPPSTRASAMPSRGVLSTPNGTEACQSGRGPTRPVSDPRKVPPPAASGGRVAQAQHGQGPTTRASSPRSGRTSPRTQRTTWKPSVQRSNVLPTRPACTTVPVKLERSITWEDLEVEKQHDTHVRSLRRSESTPLINLLREDGDVRKKMSMMPLLLPSPNLSRSPSGPILGEAFPAHSPARLSPRITAWPTPPSKKTRQNWQR